MEKGDKEKLQRHPVRHPVGVILVISLIVILVGVLFFGGPESALSGYASNTKLKASRAIEETEGSKIDEIAKAVSQEEVIYSSVLISFDVLMSKAREEFYNGNYKGAIQFTKEAKDVLKEGKIAKLNCPEVQIEPLAKPQKSKLTLTPIPANASKNLTRAVKELQKLEKAQYKAGINEQKRLREEAKKWQKELQRLAKARKESLKKQMITEPEQAMFSLLSKEERAEMGKVTKNCVEQETTVEGTLYILHYDNEDGSTENLYSLVTDGKGVITLRPAFGFKEAALSGSRMRVKGFQIDNELLFDGLSTLAFSDSSAEVISTPPPPKISGNKKGLVVLANFYNNATVPPKSQLQSIYNEASAYFSEASYSKFNLTFDVIGPYTISFDSDESCFDIIDHLDSVVRNIEASNPSFNLTKYSYLSIVAPLARRCGYSGIAYVGDIKWPSRYGVATFGYNMMRWPNGKEMGVAAHEHGHNFGNWHASFFDCGNKSIDYLTKCWSEFGPKEGAAIEYGDLYDVMGFAAFKGHFDAQHKETVGWLNSQNLKTVTTSGRYVIEPIETQTNGIKGLKIPRASGMYLYVEYRQPIGFDSNFSKLMQPNVSIYSKNISGFTDVYSGALLHVTLLGRQGNTWLLDATPSPLEQTAEKVIVPVGATFTDPWTGATITTVASNSAALIVDVTIGDIDTTPPSTSIVKTYYGIVKVWTGEWDRKGNPIYVNERHLIVNASAVDNQSREYAVFFLTSGLQSPFGGIYANGSDYYLGSFDPLLLANGNYTVSTFVYDNALNNVYSPTQVISIDNALDIKAPTVEVTYPWNNYLMRNRGPLLYNLKVVDKSPIKKIEVYLDANITPFDTWNSDILNLLRRGDETFVGRSTSDGIWPSHPFLSYGDHTIWAIAYDIYGNSKKSAVNKFTYNPDPADNIPPKVSFVYPTSNINVSGIIPIKMTYSDNQRVFDGIFYSDGTLLQVCFFCTPAFITTEYFPDGKHTLTAYVRDEFWNLGKAEIVINVENTPLEGAITGPLNGTVVSGKVPIGAIVSDEDLVDYVRLYRDSKPWPSPGAYFVALDKTPPYGFVWDTTTVPNGEHSLFLDIVDIGGGKIHTVPIRFTVNNKIGVITNNPPTVNAGPDQEITLDSAANLQGSAIDDGLPNPPRQVTTIWELANGPSPVEFEDPFALETTASFLVAGDYTLRLVASDSALESSDEINILVNEPIVVINKAPIVDAGADQIIVFPSNVTLSGNYVDDGLPEGGFVTTRWSMVRGPPEAVTFSDVSTLSTVVSFPSTGIYVFQLAANDSELEGTDDITINVRNSSEVIVESIIENVTRGTVQIGRNNNSREAAQSFKPIIPSIGSASIALSKRGLPDYPLKVSIRSIINGSDLIMAETQPLNLPNKTKDAIWVDAVFPQPLGVVQGNTYYLVVSTYKSDPKNYYKWSINSKGRYADGIFYTGTKARIKTDALAKIRG